MLELFVANLQPSSHCEFSLSVLVDLRPVLVTP